MGDIKVEQWQDWYRVFDDNNREVDIYMLELLVKQTEEDHMVQSLLPSFRDEIIEAGICIFFDRWCWHTNCDRDKLLYRLFRLERERREVFKELGIYQGPCYDHDILVRGFQDNYENHD